ncbi:MAG: (Fe-S)-binding protein [Candidatus Ranarchaeia archaeon]
MINNNVSGRHRLSILQEAINKCVRCGYCRQWDWDAVEKICPVLDFVPGWETNFARGHVWQARNLLQLEQDTQLISPLTAESLITPAFLEDVYKCTLCGSCEAHCPGEVPLLEIYAAIRATLVARDAMLPSHEALEFAIPALNPDAFSSDRPIADAIRKAQSCRPKTAEVLYYPGCTTATKTHQIPNAVINILEKTGVDYTVLSPEEESCCGLPFYEVGQMEWFEKVAKKTVRFIKNHSPQTIITTCSGCYNFLSNIYPRELGVQWNADVRHFTEFIAEILREKHSSLKLVRRIVTYHDPCTLGRGCGIYEAPRDILKMIPGVQFREIKYNRKHQVCCGAGGGVGSAFPKLAQQMAIKRLRQAENTGADTLVSSCAGCTTNFKAAIEATRSDIQMLDIAELIDEALDDGDS